MKMATEGEILVEPLIHMLKYGGLWFDFEELGTYGAAMKWFNVGKHFVAFFIWFIQTCYLGVEGFSFLLSENAVFIPIGLNEGTMAVLLVMHLNTIRRAIQLEVGFINGYADQLWARKIIRDELKRYEKIFKFPKLSLELLFLVYFSMPIVLEIVRALLGQDIYLVPLPLNFLLDDPPQRNITFYASTLLSYVYLMITVPRFIAFEALIAYFTAFMVINMKILIAKLKYLEKSDDGSVFLQKPWNLKDIVDHHASLVRTVNDNNVFIGQVLISQNVISSVSSCFVLFTMRTALKNGDFVLAFFCGAFVILLFLLNLMFNGSGFVVQSQSEELADEIYNISWYKQPPEIRKNLNFIIKQSTKGLVISYKLEPINMGASLQVMNKAYSFFTLINTKT